MDRIIWKFEKLFSIRFDNLAFPYSGANGGLITDSLTIEPDLLRINVRASATSMSLSGATLGPLPSRDLVHFFSPGNPGSWATKSVNLSGSFGVIDIVTEGSSTHRIYTDVSTQSLFYTAANGNENEHLFTIHLNN